MAVIVIYNIGGYDPDAEYSNVAESIEDHGDGTGTRTEYTANGPIVTEVTGLPIEPAPVDPPEVTAAQAISDEISSRMDEAVTIGDVKLAVTDGLLAALATLRGEA